MYWNVSLTDSPIDGYIKPIVKMYSMERHNFIFQIKDEYSVIMDCNSCCDKINIGTGQLCSCYRNMWLYCTWKYCLYRNSLYHHTYTCFIHWSSWYSNKFVSTIQYLNTIWMSLKVGNLAFTAFTPYIQVLNTIISCLLSIDSVPKTSYTETD